MVFFCDAFANLTHFFDRRFEFEFTLESILKRGLVQLTFYEFKATKIIIQLSNKSLETIFHAILWILRPLILFMTRCFALLKMLKLNSESHKSNDIENNPYIKLDWSVSVLHQQKWEAIEAE